MNLKRNFISSLIVSPPPPLPPCVASLQPQMPLFSIYSLALEQDQEQSVGLQQASTTLHTQTFIQVHLVCVCVCVCVSPARSRSPSSPCRSLQPLMQRKQEHEKRRKEIKDHWIRAKRKLVTASYFVYGRRPRGGEETKGARDDLPFRWSVR